MTKKITCEDCNVEMEEQNDDICNYKFICPECYSIKTFVSNTPLQNPKHSGKSRGSMVDISMNNKIKYFSERVIDKLKSNPRNSEIIDSNPNFNHFIYLTEKEYEVYLMKYKFLKISPLFFGWKSLVDKGINLHPPLKKTSLKKYEKSYELFKNSYSGKLPFNQIRSDILGV